MGALGTFLLLVIFGAAVGFGHEGAHVEHGHRLAAPEQREARQHGVVEVRRHDQQRSVGDRSVRHPEDRTP